MVSAGGGTSSSSSSQNLATLGLGNLLGLGAFGGEFKPSQGGLGISGFPSDPFGGGFMGPEQFQSLSTLLNPMALGPAGQMGMQGIPSNMALGALGQGNQGISQLMANLYSSGQPTDIGPIVDASRQFLSGERSRLREEMGGKGNFDSDIFGAYARAEGGAASQLGTLQFQAQEAAKDRAAGNVGAGVSGLAGQLGNIIQTFGGLFNLEDASRSAARGETPGGRTADVLSWLSGLTSPVGNVGSSQSKSAQGNVGIMGCWAAAVYYDWFTEQWWNARAWIMDGWNTLQGRLFRAFYLAHGEELAMLLRASKELRDMVRPLFEWCERSGRELRYACR